jgi:hypothetical protein
MAGAEADGAVGLWAFGLSLLISIIRFSKYNNQKKKILIKSLYIYPIKSCKGIKVSSALVTPRGFQYDRQYMLVTADGQFITQRKCAKMALIAPVIIENLGICFNLIIAKLLVILRVSLRYYGDYCTRNDRIENSISSRC